VPADGEIEFAFIVEEPRSPLEPGGSTDDRHVGILLGCVMLEEVDRTVRPAREGHLHRRLRRRAVVG
jgi:hypothetical protein